MFSFLYFFLSALLLLVQFSSRFRSRVIWCTPLKLSGFHFSDQQRKGNAATDWFSYRPKSIDGQFFLYPWNMRLMIAAKRVQDFLIRSRVTHSQSGSSVNSITGQNLPRQDWPVNGLRSSLTEYGRCLPSSLLAGGCPRGINGNHPISSTPDTRGRPISCPFSSADSSTARRRLQKKITTSYSTRTQMTTDRPRRLAFIESATNFGRAGVGFTGLDCRSVPFWGR